MLPPANDTSNELSLVRKEIKSDITGLRELMNARFKELGDRVQLTMDLMDRNNETLHEQLERHDTELNAINAWRNSVTGSIRTVAYILVAVSGLAGLLVLV